ncbi:hypothetical protein [Silvimonas sp.]|uniref:hypothetical protein n=1 Tax=Silvimonas sp. TaxID=2650811 RepID=UPI002848BE66|nr:hypothetical protein [Silvimonas sp.]MDR3429601.1 hypothetical protein [Silvimonas sp.]
MSADSKPGVSRDVPAQTSGTTISGCSSGPAARKNGLEMVRQPGETDIAALARTASSAIVRGSMTGREFSLPMFGSDTDLTAYMGALQQQADAVKAGDTAGIETMLVTQANTLDMVFNRLALQAVQNPLMQQMDTLMRLALKAQSQCRSTLEALADIKNPRPVAFVKQANIAHGPQQVNNAPPHDTAATEPAHAGADGGEGFAHGKTEKVSNELSGGGRELQANPGTPGLAGCVDTAVEAMATRHRATDSDRQTGQCLQCLETRHALTGDTG